MQTVTQNITLEETIRLLASSDAELLGAKPKELYGSLAFALIEFVILVSSRQENAFLSFTKLWVIYKDAKRRTQKGAGSLIAKSLSSMGGGSICIKIDYCRNKARLNELFDFADSYEGKAVFAKGVEEAMKTEYAEIIRKLQEILGVVAEAITEASKEIAEEVGDNVVPLSFIFMSVKYGFDELCKCCDACEGIGILEDSECAKCGGKGDLLP